MKNIDYDKFYTDFDLGVLFNPIGKFNRSEVQEIIENMNVYMIDFGIDLYKLRTAFLYSLTNDIQEKYKEKLKWVDGQQAYEFIFRATVVDRILKIQTS